MLFLRSRYLLSAIAVTAMTIVVTRRAIDFVPEISIDSSRPTRFVPLLELCPIVVAMVWLLATAPRFGEWELLGTSRYRWHASAGVAMCLVSPQIVVLASASALPRGDRWGWMAANVLAVSAIGVLLAALTGHVLAVVATAALYTATIILQNVAGPVIAWLPVTSGWDPQPRWVSAVALAATALIIYRTRGGTELLDLRRQRNDE